jgi:hypothetical protein
VSTHHRPQPLALVGDVPYEGTIRLSDVIEMYAKVKSFASVAKHYGVHRPEVRRAMSNASKALMCRDEAAEQTDPELHAIGAYIFSLIDKANPV